ncbi:MAG: hypothetical protein CMO98_02585 [Woeseia sp.]|nr:hypothetical protein [Woeseia sp.]|tara:strand:+ start:132 stop:503 length:372 start_codon:yes stop_codon:yes gene_type:complete
MSASYHYDTVAFDVRENTTMLFFARTNIRGDIEDYLLLMRTAEETREEFIFLEVNEEQLDGSRLIRAAEMSGNILSLFFLEPIKVLDGATRLVLTFENSEENRKAMEVGAFRVLGDKLTGGHA